ncbi:DUF1127 domain-containing protein [Mesorhizobium sp. CO1-1-7]|uniref:DUF1127 domain-containing protein n=1 Tax=unclassified Mesorhizobium TaxID=325217 RepID=UPI0011290104|nr:MULTISPECIES: DUF1127 domain-containing protein [unclassified Mesorhizobium]MBZ9930008.1 DUF1127 domain-containing protein [Mesorhizobium sp. BR1-1-5]MBZ9747226.1 DUF1127 domain-containing protein [Mesorhizobium sp. CO1-1-7]MBZ9755861.1 DUF1127 domain-containing protein [Mesorhizobium sp. ESP6-5]MBZ9906702.1 DUF1127 domain-containing protein [Mesorhizobium sp. BR115XR7A]TPJ18940.1 DUF1127 domain-containing protein [Mesorhizobium sp. B2-7-3]
MPEIDIVLARPRTRPSRLMAVIAWLAYGWHLRHGRRRLEAMPGFMLKDIGISRCAIDHVARHGET